MVHPLVYAVLAAVAVGSSGIVLFRKYVENKKLLERPSNWTRSELNDVNCVTCQKRIGNLLINISLPCGDYVHTDCGRYYFVDFKADNCPKCGQEFHPTFLKNLRQ